MLQTSLLNCRYVLLFPYVIWPLGNIAITASVMMVIAVSYERFLAICSPLQYKPSPGMDHIRRSLH